MTKRRDVVALIERNGFVSKGGTNHEKFVHQDGRVAIVPRHREIKDRMFEIIKKQAGLRWPREGSAGMKLSVYEFEVYEDEGWLIAEPYDFDGGTQGEGYDDLCMMVADWLKVTVEDHAVHGRPLPKATFGNAPRHGGSNLVVGVHAGLDTVERVTAADAARLLGVSPSRVSQMLAANQLEGWREGHSSYVTLDSVNARLADERRAGRPRKEELAIA